MPPANFNVSWPVQFDTTSLSARNAQKPADVIIFHVGEKNENLRFATGGTKRLTKDQNCDTHMQFRFVDDVTFNVKKVTVKLAHTRLPSVGFRS